MVGPMDRQLELGLTEYVPSPYISGKEWERDFAALATSRGMQVTKMHHSCCFDLACNGWRVQCKATKFVDYCGTGRQIGRIRISRGSGCSAANNYNAGDFDIFAVLFNEQVFILPVAAVGFVNGKIRRRVSLNTLFLHKDNWGAFNGTGVHSAQLELFDGN